MIGNMNTARRRNKTLSVIGLAALLSVAVLPLAIGFPAPPAPAATVAPSAGIDFGKLPLSFESNQGQKNPSVRSIAHASGETMYFTPSEIILALQPAQPASERQPSGGSGAARAADPPPPATPAATVEYTIQGPEAPW